MAKTLKLRFTGLCGFVPREPVDDSSTIGRNRMRVLLVDATGSDGGHGAHRHEHHEPVLVIPEEHVDSGGEGYRKGRKATIWKKDVRIFSLMHQDLFIGKQPPDPGESTLTVEYSPIPDDGCPDSQSARSFAWVAPMAQIDGVGDGVKMELLAADGVTALGARVWLTRGTLANAVFARDNGSILKWRFTSDVGGAGGPKQALSEEVEYSLEVSEAPFDLLTRTTVGSHGGQPVYFEERVRVVFKEQDEVVGYIMNMPWMDILRRRESRPRRIGHFSHLYELRRNPRQPEDRRLPEHMGAASCSGVGVDDPSPNPIQPPQAAAEGEADQEEFLSVTNPRCPPTQLAPDPDA